MRFAAARGDSARRGADGSTPDVPGLPRGPGWATVPSVVAHDAPDVLRRLAFAPDAETFTRAAAGVDDWSALLRLARPQGLAGVLYHRAKDSGVALSERARAEGEERDLGDAIWFEHLELSLAEQSRALSAAGVRAVVLKGPPLARRVYDPPHARVAMDLDWLVEPGALPVAMEALAPLGYRRLGTGEAAEAREHHHVHLTHDSSPPVELHFHAHEGFGRPVPAGPLVERARARGGAGSPLELEPVDELVYLAAHAAGHAFSRASWLLDVALLLRRSDAPPIASVLSRARALGASRAVRLALAELSDLDPSLAAGVRAPRLPRAILALERAGRLPAIARNLALRAALADDPSRAAFHVLRKVLRDGPLAVSALLRRVRP